MAEIIKIYNHNINKVELDPRHKKVMIPVSIDFNEYKKDENRTITFETDNLEFDGKDDFYPILEITATSNLKIMRIANTWATTNGWRIDWKR